MIDNRFQAKGFLVWGICALFFLYEFLLRMVIGTYQHQVMIDLEISSFQFSLLSSTTFCLVSALMQIPAGLIIDNIGLKKSLIIGAIFCSFSSIGFAYSYSYNIAIISRLFMGFGASFGFICLLISVYDWMPHKNSALFIGLSQFIGTLGPVVAAGPLESLSHSLNIDWRFMFLILGSIGIVLIGLIILFVENNHSHSGKNTILYKPVKVSIRIKRLFSRIQPWNIAVLSACLYFTIEYLSENEGRSFLALKGISAYHAGYMITIAWIGYAIGCPLFGYISDKLERRKIILNFCSVLAIVAILMLLYLPEKAHLQVAFFLLGMSASGQSIGFAIIGDQFKKQFVAIGFGLNNGMIGLISAINAPLLGLLLDYSLTGSTYTLGNYLSVFSVLIFIAVLAVIFSFFCVKETYCKSAVEFTLLKT